MILTGLIAAIWIVTSLLGVALCRAAGVADCQQHKTSFAGRAEAMAHRLAPRISDHARLVGVSCGRA